MDSGVLSKNMAWLAKSLLSGILGKHEQDIETLKATPPGSASFTTIAGSPSDCTALQSALDDKADVGDLSGHLADTNNPHSVTKTQVGLGSVTNDAQLKAIDLDTDGALAANSDTKIASQKAVKTYVDAHAGGGASSYAPSFWRPNGLGSDAGGYQGFTERSVIGDYATTCGLLLPGTKLKLKLQGASAATATLDHVSIVERSGATGDGTTTPTEVTFGGGGHGCVIPAGGFIISDEITFTIDPLKQYLVIQDFNASVASTVRREGATIEYQKAATASWNVQTITGSGYSTYGYLISVVAVLVK